MHKLLVAILLLTHLKTSAQDVSNSLSNAYLDIEELPTALQSRMSTFLRTAAFDWGHVWFNIRNLETRESQFLFNGSELNRLLDDSHDWNMWSGLNEVLRNNIQNEGIKPFAYAVGRLGNIQVFKTNPFELRQGNRITFSSSNRSYRHRAQYYYTKIRSKDAFTFALANRGAKEGYYEASPYLSRSVFAAYSWRKKRHQWYMGYSGVDTRRASMNFITKEVFDLYGSRYNPYWGVFNNSKRNARIKHQRNNLLQLNWNYQRSNYELNLGADFIKSVHAKSRLSHQKASNPLPTYYRNLPSYSLSNSNSSWLGLFKTYWLEKERPQINWAELFLANSQGVIDFTPYVFLDDVEERFGSNIFFHLEKNSVAGLDFQVYLARQSEKYALFAQVKDLLGAPNYLDIDSFSQTQNNALDASPKGLNERINYNVGLNAKEREMNFIVRKKYDDFKAYVALNYKILSFQRDGKFQNGRYPQNSLGTDVWRSFNAYNFKIGLEHQIEGKHYFDLNYAWSERVKSPQEHYLNLRENAIFLDLKNEKRKALELKYSFHTAQLQLYSNVYHYRIKDQNERNRFYLDHSDFADFTHQIVHGISSRASGLDLGMDFQLDSTWSLSLACALFRGYYLKADHLDFYSDDLMQTENQNDFHGLTFAPNTIRNAPLTNHPSRALSLGLNMRTNNYLFAAVTYNFISKYPIDFAWYHRTEQFLNQLGSLMGTRVDRLPPNHIPENNYLNLLCGKSWRLDDGYLLFFSSISNVLNRIQPISGFEQSRLGKPTDYLQDQVRTTPIFGPKYWYAMGRNYFINLSYRF